MLLRGCTPAFVKSGLVGDIVAGKSEPILYDDKVGYLNPLSHLLEISRSQNMLSLPLGKGPQKIQYVTFFQKGGKGGGGVDPKI